MQDLFFHHFIVVSGGVSLCCVVAVVISMYAILWVLIALEPIYRCG